MKTSTEVKMINTGLVAFCILCMALAVVCFFSFSAEAQEPEKAIEARPYPAYVVKIVNSTTTDVMVDLGLGVFKAERIKLIGVVEPFSSQEPKMRALVSKMIPVGKRVLVISTGERTSKGELLSVVQAGLYPGAPFLNEFFKGVRGGL